MRYGVVHGIHARLDVASSQEVGTRTVNPDAMGELERANVFWEQSGDTLVHVMDVTDPHGQVVQVKLFAKDLSAPAAVFKKFCAYHDFQPPEACEAEVMRALAPDLERLRAQFPTASKSRMHTHPTIMSDEVEVAQQAPNHAMACHTVPGQFRPVGYPTSPPHATRHPAMTCHTAPHHALRHMCACARMCVRACARAHVRVCVRGRAQQAVTGYRAERQPVQVQF